MKGEKQNMNKLFTKIAKLAVGLSMAAGVGVAISSSRKAQSVSASESTYTFTSKSWADSTNSWTSNTDGSQKHTNGVQVTTGTNNGSAKTKTSISNVTKVSVSYCTNANSGAGSISVKIGSDSYNSKSVTNSGGTSARSLTWDYSPAKSGVVDFKVNTTTNSIYIKSVTITTSGGGGGDSGAPAGAATSTSFSTTKSYVLRATSSNNGYYLSDTTSSARDSDASYGICTTTEANGLRFKLSGSTASTSTSITAVTTIGGIPYYIKALSSGKFHLSSSSQSLTLKEDGTIHNPSNDNYAVHYNSSGGYRWYSNNTTLAKGYFIEAQETSYTITYNANGGEGTMSNTVGATVTAAENGFTRTGYAFTGWNEAADGSGTSYAAGATVNKTVTLYAQWSINKFSVTYNKNTTDTVTGMPSTATNINYGTNYTLSTDSPTRSGYSFDGWSTTSGDNNASGKVTSILVNESKTVYAIWGNQRTLSSISVSTAPTTTSYNEGECFDPTGLVITRSFEDSSSDTYTYSGHTSEFSFSPDTSTPLTTSDTSVSITYGGKSTTQVITVNAVTGATFTPGTDTGTNSVTKNGISVSMSTMDNSSYYQIYASASATFTAPTNRKISKIEFTCTVEGTGKYGPGNASANVGTYSYSGAKGTWTGSSATVTISSTAQVRMTSLVVTLEATGPAIVIGADFSYIKSAQDTAKSVNATVVNPEEGKSYTLLYATSNSSVAEVDSTGVITPTGVGDVTITVSEKDSKLASVQFSFSVLSVHGGLSVDDPLTQPEAVAFIDTLPSSELSNTYYYVGGNITSITSGSYYLDDTEFELYYAVAGSGIDLSDAKVGRYVIGYGKLLKSGSDDYYLGDTPSIVYIQMPALVSLAFTDATMTKTTYSSKDSSWNVSGLVVNGTYEGESPADVTSSVNWSYSIASPNSVSFGNEDYKDLNLDITASIGEVSTTKTVSVRVTNDGYSIHTSNSGWEVVSSLTAGDVVVIADSDKGKVMTSSVPATGTLGVDTVSISNGVISSLPDSAVRLTVGGSTGAWTLRNSEGKYLKVDSSATSRDLKFITDEYTFAVTFSNNQATIGGTSRIVLNTQSGMTARFSTYTADLGNTMTLPEIYKMTGIYNIDKDADLVVAIGNFYSTNPNDSSSKFVCDDSGVNFDVTHWNNNNGLKSLKTKYELNLIVANANGNIIEQFLSMYDYVIGTKKNTMHLLAYADAEDFLGRFEEGGINYASASYTISNKEIISVTKAAIIVIISMVSMTAIGGYFFLRRRKEQ